MTSRGRLRRTGLVLLALALLGKPGPAKDAPAVVSDRHGDPLPAGATARMGTIHFRHGSFPTYVAFLPDGKTLVSAGAAIRVWELPTGRELRTLRPSPFGLGVLRFSPDGTTVVAMGEGQTIRLLDVATGTERHRLDFPTAIANLAVAPGGRSVAILGTDQAIYRWPPRSGKTPERFARLPAEPKDHHPAPMSSTPAFSGNGKLLAVANAPGAEGAILVWDLTTGQALPRLTGLPQGHLSFRFSPDGKTLAAFGVQEQKVHVFDVATGRPLPAPVQDRVQSLAYSPDGRTLALAAARKIVLVDAATGKPKTEMETHGLVVRGLAFSPDGKQLAGTGSIHRVLRWDVASGKEVGWPDGHADNIVAIALSRDGRTLATVGTGDPTVRLWETGTGKPLRSLVRQAAPEGPPELGPTVKLAFVQGGRLLAAGYLDGTVSLWKVAKGKEERSFQAHERGGLVGLAAAPDGRSLATAGSDGLVRLWDTATARELRRFQAPYTDTETGEVPGFDFRLAFSSDGHSLATSGVVLGPMPGAEQTKIHLWELSSGKQRHELQVPIGVRTVPGRIGLGNGGGLVGMFAGGPGMPGPGGGAGGPGMLGFGGGGMLGPPGFRGDFSSLTLVPGGRQVAIGDGTNIQLWDVARARELRRFVGSGLETHAVVLSADGKLLLAGDFWGQIHFWDVATGTPLRKVAGHPGAIRALALSHDGKILVSVGTEATALVWDAARLLEAGRAGARPLSSGEMDALWADLAAADAARAFRAMGTLTDHPGQSVPFLRERLRPVPQPEPAQIDRLIAQLNSDRFAARTRAAEELERLGDLAEPALRRALAAQPALEMRRRFDRLLEGIDGPVQNPELLRGLRAVEVLEQTGTPEAQQVLQTLAGGAPGSRLTRDARAAWELLAVSRDR